MGVRRIGRWKITAAVALLLGSCPWGGMAGGLRTELTSATTVSATNAPLSVPLKLDTPYYFSKYRGNQAELLELNVDGIYRLLGRRHDFVKEIDRGTWKPGPTLGEVIMISAGYFEGVKAGVLGVDLVSTSTLDNLTSVSLALADVLTSVAATGGVVTVRDYMMMMRMHPAHIGREPQVDGKRAYGPKEQAILKSDEIEAFAAAVKTTLAAPTPTSETLTLRIYKEVTYLDVPASIRFPWAGMSSYGGGPIAIDKRGPAERIFETFVQVPHEEYVLAATTTQPWLFVPDLSTSATAEAMNRREQTAEWADPAVAPIAALRSVAPGLMVDSRPTSTTNELASLYSSTGPTTRARIGGGLSGRLMYLFPDGEYMYLEWADIKPRTIESRGRWHIAHGYVVVKDDGVLKPQRQRLDDQAFLPVSFGIDGMRPTGLLGFPEAYERVFTRMDPKPYHILFGLLERTENLEKLGDWKAKKDELMRKHWRPDWLAGVKGAAPPEW